MRSKKLIFIYTFILVACIVYMFSLRKGKPLPVDRDYPEIREEGVLRLITEYNQSGYYVTEDTTGGFQYELGRAIADISGLEVQMLLQMNLAESFRALENNACDVVAQNIPVTAEDKENYLFTDPIVFNKQILIQRKAEANNEAGPIRNHLELRCKTVHIPQNSPARVRLNNLANEIGDTIYIVENELYSSEQLLILVAKGEIDFAVCDQNIAMKYQEHLPELDLETDISFTQLQSWAVRKDSPVLLDSLNSWIGRLKESGIFNKIYKKYYINRESVFKN